MNTPADVPGVGPSSYVGLTKEQCRSVAKRYHDTQVLFDLATSKEVKMMEIETRKSIEELVLDEGKDVEKWSHNNQTDSFKKELKIPRYAWIPDLGEIWSEGLSLAFSRLPQHLVRYVYFKFTELGIWNVRDSRDLSTAFKLVSTLAKKGKELWDANWMFFVDWQNLGGVHGFLNSEEEKSKFMEDVIKFLTPIDRSDLWLDKFRQKLIYVASSWKWGELDWGSIFTPYGLFLRPRLWATTGSSVGSVSIKLKDGNSTKTKWSSALSMEKEDLDEILAGRGDKAREAHPFPKIETTYRKVPRAVINGSLSLYYNMACLYQVISKVYKGDDRCLSWLGSTREVLEMIIGYQLYDSRDSVQFDHHVKSEEVMIGFDVLEYFFNSVWPMGVEKWFVQIFKNIRSILNDLRVSGIKWLNGLLSGWLVTSFFGSWFNLSYTMVARENSGSPEQKEVVMGDDYISICKKAGDSLAVWRDLRKNAFEIKSGDSTIANSGEFVRYVINMFGATGYPIRSIPALRWSHTYISNPDPVAQMQEALVHYCTGVGRGLSYDSCKRQCIAELEFLHQDGFKWAVSPATLGGGGMWEWGVQYLNWKVEQQDIEEFEDKEKKAIPILSKLAQNSLNENFGIKDVPKEFSNLVKSKKRGQLLRKHKVLFMSKYAKFKPLTDSPDYTCSSSRPLSPRYNFLNSTLLGWDVWLNDRIEERDYKSIRLQLDDDKSKGVFDLLISRAPRRITNYWLKQKLPFSSPKYALLNPELVSHVNHGYTQQAWNELLTHSKITYTSLLDLALQAEYLTFNRCSSGEMMHWSP